jgi:ribonuclease Z
MDGMTRRDFIAASGLTAGAAWAGSALGGLGGLVNPEEAAAAPAPVGATQTELARRLIQNSWYLPVEELEPDEMRISFMGSSFTPRVNQAMNSVFIEVGTGQSFVFDLGSGTITKYTAMGIPSSRMTRVFITHLHADHMSDLVALYCFGPAHDRKTPLHIYGPSGPILKGVDYKDEGTAAFCANLLKLCKWHSDAMSFLNTGLTNGEDGYQIVPHELSYRKDPGVAYKDKDVLITHFPAAHDRDGSISYKLEFNGMKVVFSGDTKPTDWMLKHGIGADVLIHEMALSVNDWVNHQAGLYPGDAGYQQAYELMKEVQDNSHTPEEALGETLALTKPRLGVITHCHFNQDTFIQAVDRVRRAYQGPLAWAIDNMVLNLRPGQERIRQRMALASDYAWDLGTKSYDNLAPSKYDGPYAQFSDFTMRHILPKYK